MLLGLLDMIRFVKGNLLESSDQALVNTVNTIGVMGKGIASHFKEVNYIFYSFYHEWSRCSLIPQHYNLIFFIST